MIFLVAIGGLALRLPRLAERPMHCDEAVHAIKFNTLWQTGEYIYDPSEYHGPTLYYFALPLAWLSGASDFDHLSEATLRLTPVIFGVLMILLLLFIRDGLGSAAAIWAALLTAVSPAFVYYSRYYIQEVLLVCFTFAALAFAWRCAQANRHKGGWAILTGVAIGLMHGTKETCVIAWACAAIALAITCLVGPSKQTATVPEPHKCAISWRLVYIAAGAAAFVSVTLFTAFFQNYRGPIDSLLTYKTYFDRAGNHGLHNHSLFFYWHRLLWWHYPPAPAFSEVVIFAAGLVGTIAAFCKGQDAKQEKFQRFLVFYTLAMSVVYTVIPYKTPWCALGFLHGWILLAGIGLNSISTAFRGRLLRGIATAACLTGVCWLLDQSARSTSRKFAADHRNPYVYAHTVNDLLDLGTFVEKVAAATAAMNGLSIHVFATDHDSWPLPWYLRRMRDIGYWDALTQSPDADVVITSLDLVERFEAARTRTYPLVRYYGLRPGVQLAVFISENAWEAFRAAQPAAKSITSEVADEAH